MASMFPDNNTSNSRERLLAVREKIEQAGLRHEAEVHEVFSYTSEVLTDKVLNQALISAAANGHAILTRLLLPYITEHGRRQAFDMAINRGKAETLEALIPWIPAHFHASGMEAAIRKKNIETFDLLLPLVNPSLTQSHFLEVALICGNLHAARQLMPLSEPWVFARKMRRDNVPNFDAMAQIWTESLMASGGPQPPPTRSVKLLLKLVPNVQSALRHIELAQTLAATGPTAPKPRF